ncbi:MAG: esterase-like activity of phytase family protein [Alsobacter sp.]
MRLDRRRLLRLAALGAAGAVLPAGLAAGPFARQGAARSGDAAGPRIPADIASHAIAVVSRPFRRFSPIAGDRTRFGELDFVGGVELSSADKRFGGWSGLWIGPEGRLLSVSDHGSWLSARLVVDDGRPVGLADTLLAPILGPDGRPVASTRRFDTESLALAGGVAYVGVERVHEVLRFAIGQDGLGAAGQVVPAPASIKQLPANRSLEAVGVVPAGPLAGRLIAIAERSDPGEDTPTRGFVLTGGFAEFSVARNDGYDISDLAFLPGGDMLLLERRFQIFTGIRMRVRRIAAGSIRPGALLDGPSLIEAGVTTAIDNMEGLAVHRGPGGETLLTMISDDNFSSLQKTVLLQFRLATGVG